MSYAELLFVPQSRWWRVICVIPPSAIATSRAVLAELACKDLSNCSAGGNNASESHKL